MSYESIELQELMDDLSYNDLHILYLSTTKEKEFCISDDDKYLLVNYSKHKVEQSNLEKHQKCTLMYNLINEFKEYDIRKGFILCSNDLYVIINNHVMEFNNEELLEIMFNSIRENKTITDYILNII